MKWSFEKRWNVDLGRALSWILLFAVPIAVVNMAMNGSRDMRVGLLVGWLLHAGWRSAGAELLPKWFRR